MSMSALPEPLGRPRSSSFRSLAGTLEANLGMGTLEADREEMRILKVCFYSNSFNMGKNFKLVKCPVTTEIRVCRHGAHGDGEGGGDLFVYPVAEGAPIVPWLQNLEGKESENHHRMAWVEKDHNDHR